MAHSIYPALLLKSAVAATASLFKGLSLAAYRGTEKEKSKMVNRVPADWKIHKKLDIELFQRFTS
jgi:hypothetical protein